MTVSIRTRLIALMLAAALPAVVLMGLTGRELEENVVSAAETYALHQVQSMAAHHERIVENARLLLATLAGTSEARGLDRAACQELLEGIQRGNPVYVSLALADAGGAILSSAPVRPPAARASDARPGKLGEAPYFRAALARGGFVTGDYVYLKDARRVVLNFAQPIAGGRGVLLAAFDLNHFGSLFEDAALPPGSVFTLTDAKGMRLTRFPETEKYTWLPDLPRMLEKMTGSRDEGTFREVGVDGVLRLYAFKRLHFAGAPFPYLMIRLGIPVDKALAQARSVVRRNLLLLFAAAALSMGSAWVLGEVAVVRKLKGLLAAAVRVGEGQLEARTGLAGGNDEISRLGQAFDSMAQALQERERERQGFENEVCHLNEFLEERVETRTKELAAANKELTETLERLSQAQEHLVQSEKMASLGALVAGVAHEINTPVGIGVTAASHLEDKTKALLEEVRAGALKRASLDEFLNTCDESTRMILSNLRRASDLIRSFKQVAVDRSTEERRVFRLREYLEQVLLSLRPHLKKTALAVDLDCDPELAINSYPGVFSQILTNLVMNALQHAFEPGQAGRIGIRLTLEQGRLRFVFTDDGRGIAPEHLGKIFEPFYTTYRQHGGSGLGLSIVYNLVSSTLGGTIHAASAPGQGTTFNILVPLDKTGGAEPASGGTMPASGGQGA
ncbi:MAG: HAMP domain-containing protein [Proteobacteria bacterium]|nr:HAMP domain-containing protein [Pseudomonadota bacterium]MBU1595027.1 HAMP domain-containing protein [Pseudomonadota bacterium]